MNDTGKPFVNRKSISVVEDVDVDITGAKPRPSWEAALYGRLSTGEHVEMSRNGSSFQEAMESLTTAIEENGWRIL